MGHPFLEDVIVIEEGWVIGHLLWDKAGLKICGKAGHKKSAAICKENKCTQDYEEGISLQFSNHSLTSKLLQVLSDSNFPAARSYKRVASC